MAELKFYKCNHCANILTAVNDGGVVPSCCGEKMELLTVNTTDAATEKHVPVIEKPDDHHVEVKVGSVEHPMTEEHFIQWIIIVQDEKTQFVRLAPGEKPAARYSMRTSDGPVAAYEYCNLHGLWKAEVE